MLGTLTQLCYGVLRILPRLYSFFIFLIPIQEDSNSLRWDVNGQDEVDGEMKSVGISTSRKHDFEAFTRKLLNHSHTPLKKISLSYLLHKRKKPEMLSKSTERTANL